MITECYPRSPRLKPHSIVDFFHRKLVYRYVQRDSRTTVMKRKTETPKEDAKKSKKDDSSSGRSNFLSPFPHKLIFAHFRFKQQ